jgi:hypothetical protein
MKKTAPAPDDSSPRSSSMTPSRTTRFAREASTCATPDGTNASRLRSLGPGLSELSAEAAMLSGQSASWAWPAAHRRDRGHDRLPPQDGRHPRRSSSIEAAAGSSSSATPGSKASWVFANSISAASPKCRPRCSGHASVTTSNNGFAYANFRSHPLPPSKRTVENSNLSASI